MQIIPAVDIQHGKCVRLTQGKIDSTIVYNESPVNAAIMWQNQGAEYLHLVDLDGAFSGATVNFEVIKQIVSALKIPAEIGGGIRSYEAIEKYINIGIDRVVLGTKAVTSEKFLREAIRLFGSKIAVAIDATSGKITIEGWTKAVDKTIPEFVKEIENVGVKTIIYTDTTTDGTLKGPNFTSIKEFMKQATANVIISGGISKLEDIKQLKEIGRISGVITGKALYTGSLKLSEALAIC